MNKHPFNFFLSDEEIGLLNQSKEPLLQNLSWFDFFTQDELKHRNHLDDCPQKIKVEDKILRIQCAVRNLLTGSNELNDLLPEDEFIQYLEHVDQDKNSQKERLEKYQASKASLEERIEENRNLLRSFRTFPDKKQPNPGKCTTCGKELRSGKPHLWGRVRHSTNLAYLVGKYGADARKRLLTVSFEMKGAKSLSLDLFKYFTREELNRAFHSKGCPSRTNLLTQVNRLEARIRSCQFAHIELSELEPESSFMDSLRDLERCCREVKIQAYQRWICSNGKLRCATRSQARTRACCSFSKGPKR